ncbi:hypothetical protein TWF694_005413 [Orbilia ellipsospora]|uniref:Uncharacterized protein n=1 Tax=Orbilia ellipsospora TaxID=2528407 RepID=A0AAV9WVH5_9PEZI
MLPPEALEPGPPPLIAPGPPVPGPPPQPYKAPESLIPRPPEKPNIINLYPHPTDTFAKPITYREVYLRRFSAEIRSRPNWTEEILDRTFLAKQLDEAQKRDCILPGGKVIVWEKEDIEFIYWELTKAYKPYVDANKATGLQPHIDGVWRSDSLVSESLRKDLIAAVATLEDVPEDQKNWHLGSDGRVLNLVHPSYWPVIYGRTLSIDKKEVEIHQPEVRERDNYEDDHEDDRNYEYTYEDDYDPDDLKSHIRSVGYDVDSSWNFCWLPSEFNISSKGDVKIASYINNLALPEQQRLFYPLIEQIFSEFVPLFNHVLADLKTGTHRLQRIDWDWERSTPFYGEWPRVGLDTPGPSQKLIRLTEEEHATNWQQLIKQFEDEEELTTSLKSTSTGKSWVERALSHIPFGRRGYSYAIRNIGTPPCRIIWQPPRSKIMEEARLEGKTAKVIVKLGNIVLTPERPRYDGGRWHIEGMKNERIVATGIYYYDQENITDSTLGFRRTLLHTAGLDHLRDPDGVTQTQEVGCIKTETGRGVAFPNIFQHRVAPFQLVDKTKPGYRKILVFFLCDPSEHHKMPTTKTVPPQQPDVREAALKVLRGSPADKLPVELFQEIIKDMPPAISKEEALKYYGKLMEERAGWNPTSRAVRGKTRIEKACD